jgi:hypothetical protein
MTRNRSAPPASVTPILTYPEVGEAVAWLSRVFGFVEHVRIGDHRAQLGFVPSDVLRGTVVSPMAETYTRRFLVDSIHRIHPTAFEIARTCGRADRAKE